eukprot:1625197-Pyramimonas_sp.AAC.1
MPCPPSSCGRNSKHGVFPRPRQWLNHSFMPKNPFCFQGASVVNLIQFMGRSAAGAEPFSFMRGQRVHG